MNKSRNLKDCGFLPSYVVNSIPERQKDFLAIRHGLDWSLNQKIREPMTFKQVGDYFDFSAAQAQSICYQGIGNLRKRKQLFHKDTLKRRIYLYVIAYIDFLPLIKEAIPLFHHAKEKIATTSIEELGLDPRSYNSLRNSKIKTAGDILNLLPDGLLELPGIGAKSVTKIVKALADLEESMFN